MGIASTRDRRFKINAAYKNSKRKDSIKAASRGLLRCAKCKADREGRRCNKAHNRNWIHCKMYGSKAWLTVDNSYSQPESSLVFSVPDQFKWKRPTQNDVDTFFSAYTNAANRGLPNISLQPRAQITSWSMADVRRLFKCFTQPTVVDLPPNLAIDPELSAPKYHPAFDVSFAEIEIGVLETTLGLIESIELTEVVFLHQSDPNLAQEIHELFGINHPTPTKTNSTFRQCSRTIPTLVVSAMTDLLRKWTIFDLPYDIMEVLHYEFPPPTKTSPTGDIVKPTPLLCALQGCKLYILDLVKMRKGFLPGGLCPCANPECPKPDMRAQHIGVSLLGAGGITRILRTDGFYDYITLRLLQTRKVGPGTFSTTLNDLAIKAYTEREGAYYSQGLEYIRHLEGIVGDPRWEGMPTSQQATLLEARAELLSSKHSTFVIAPFPTASELCLKEPPPRQALAQHLQDSLASAATYRRRELQGVVAKLCSAHDVTYFAAKVCGTKGIVTETIETGELANARGVSGEKLEDKADMLESSSARVGWDASYVFYDTAPARGEDVKKYTKAKKVAPDLFHDQKNIISKLHNGDKRFKWVSSRVKWAFVHIEESDIQLIDAHLRSGALSGRWKLFQKKWPAKYQFSQADIDSFKELQWDPISGRKLKLGLYWETFKGYLREVWNRGATIKQRLRELLGETLRLEGAEGRGPTKKGGSVFSAAAVLAVKRAIGRANLYEDLASSDYPQHRRIPGKMRKCALLCIASGAKKSKHDVRRGRNAERMRQVRAAKKMKGAGPSAAALPPPSSMALESSAGAGPSATALPPPSSMALESSAGAGPSAAALPPPSSMALESSAGAGPSAAALPPPSSMALESSAGAGPSAAALPPPSSMALESSAGAGPSAAALPPPSSMALESSAGNSSAFLSLPPLKPCQATQPLPYINHGWSEDDLM
ncbi:hypothetical protein CYMTET_8108 [Cymbomonas tetramitiformis]|uniref:Uncharacterized protein n=1 Tax=Cymbomonas tetramitiformis TaxID=36881 RepID=A0AAE0GUA1_9CHLO|nr:hypothetical protein CYMTET_8108 [Cymbomonas tetramitiformis]